MDVPSGRKKPVCKTEELGQLSAIAGVDSRTVVTVIGFRKVYAGDSCLKELHFVNVVLGSEPTIEPARKDGDEHPWYDGETRDQPAGNTGEFGGPDNNLAKTSGWAKDTKLDLVFGHRPEELKPGLEYLTVLVGVEGKSLCPLAGVAWGMRPDGAAHLDWPKTGDRLTAMLAPEKLQAAIAKSGFAGYTVKPSCCSCGAPVKRPRSAKKK
jgi:hypothetical protein